MFPVYAGVILFSLLYTLFILGVPRVCGGDPIFDVVIRFLSQVFPVYAGVIPQEDVEESISDRVPRVCGGDPKVSVSVCLDV